MGKGQLRMGKGQVRKGKGRGISPNVGSQRVNYDQILECDQLPKNI